MFLGHKVPQSLWKESFDLPLHLEAVYKVSDSRELSTCVELSLETCVELSLEFRQDA